MPDVMTKRRLQLLYGIVVALLALVLVITFAIGSSGGAEPGALAARRGPLGSIAFVSDRDGNSEIYSVRPDGGGLVRLTDHPAADFMPAWSLDGRQLAFVSDRGGTLDVYVMDGDGTNLRPSSRAPAPIAPPSGRRMGGRWCSSATVMGRRRSSPSKPTGPANGGSPARGSGMAARAGLPTVTGSSTEATNWGIRRS